MIKKSLTTPRGYLSWSQLSLYEKDPQLYYQVYWEGVAQFKTKYLELGKRMAKTLENGYDEEHDPVFEEVMRIVPPYPKREVKIKKTFEGIPLVGIMDGFDEKNLVIGEFKTGKKWTQSMADTTGQLTFYALLVWLKYKKIPNSMYLHWASTVEDEEGNLRLTGIVRTFKTKRSLSDIILLSKRIKKAWKAIAEMQIFINK